MELLNLPRLRMKELQSVAESTLRICVNITELQPATQQVNTHLEAFKKGMLKEQASAADKKELDKERDRLLSGFMQDLKAEQYFPHQELATVDTLNKVLEITQKYGVRIYKLSYSEESSAIDNILSELEQVDTQALDNGITRWIPLIKTANNHFKTANSTYISNQVKADVTDSASALAPDLRQALEGIYTLLFAHTKITATEPILNAYRELEILIKSFD